MARHNDFYQTSMRLAILFLGLLLPVCGVVSPQRVELGSMGGYEPVFRAAFLSRAVPVEIVKPGQDAELRLEIERRFPTRFAAALFARHTGRYEESVVKLVEQKTGRVVWEYPIRLEAGPVNTRRAAERFAVEFRKDTARTGCPCITSGRSCVQRR